MTNEQLYLAIGIPMLFNAGLIAFVFLAVNSRISSVESRITSLEARMMNLENTFTTRFDLLMGG